MPRRFVPVLLVCLLFAGIAIEAIAQNANSRAYRRPTISKGSPKKPLTGPAAGRPSELAKGYLLAHGDQADLTETDVQDAAVTSEYRSGHSGISHVYLRQRVDGIEVFGAESNFNVGPNGEVLSFGTSFLPEARASINTSSPTLGAVQAVLAAAAQAGLAPSTPITTTEVRGGPDQETVLTDGGIASSPIVAKLVYQPVAERELRLAWQVDIDEASGQHLWRMTVDAQTGEVLNQEDWVTHDNWDLPADAVEEQAGSFLAREAEPLSSPNPVIDGSSYRVFALPAESPNDASQSVVSNPADMQASPYGWHDTSGGPGAEFTITRGNNVHAYLDQDTSNGPDSGDTDGGASLTFNFQADLNEHAQNYRDAAVTNLFYWNNIFHDLMWLYGFNEPAGNFQANNYGRGGLGGDYVRAEAADGGGTNNANFSTPAETATSSGTPRMQMYLWPGTSPTNFGAANQVVVDGVGSFDGTWSRFGRAPIVAGTAGRIVDVGTGCAPADYAGAPMGTNWIAVVTGGTAGCPVIDKVRQAGNAGAQAVIVAHNGTGSAPILTAASGAMNTPVPNIPVVSITQADGNTIRAAIAAGPVTGTVRKHPNHPGIRDGDFENGIVLHEYGHGVSLRLTGGPASLCLSGDEQGGEGWSDYFAMLVTMNPALDNAELGRGMGPYALFQPSRQGSGIRPRPYSRDMSVQPFTYDSIKTGGWLNGGSLAAPHGIGHGWASVLWDMTWDLIDRHGFNRDLYAPWHTGGNNRALQYVTDGLKLQGCAPGFIAARDAIIAAAEALDPGDVCIIWAAFARRGLGYSAIQGSTSRGDNVEAFDTLPACRANFAGSIQPGPAMNVANVGSTVSFNFTVPGATGLDILVKNSPYSRQVECSTLRTLDPNAQFITPRPLPIPMQAPGNSGLSYDSKTGMYTFPWKTDSAWAGTCREAVFTRKDGVQHRAFFLFESGPSFPVSGHVRDSSGNPVPNATVRITGSPYGAVTTNSEGFYSFLSVAKGTYTATATPAGAGCVLPQTLEFTVSRPTTLNFTLGARSDAFGYTCRNETAAFEEAAIPALITGTSGVGSIDLPFPFMFYGQVYERAYACANGFVEFAGPGTTNCSSANGTIPGTGRPNGAIYPFWDDLVVDALSSIRTELKGAAPNRRFVIEFRNLHVSGNTSQRVDFNAILLENGQVLMQHRNIGEDPRERGNSATIGIEIHTGTVALMYSLNTAVLSVEPGVTTIRYTPPTLHTVAGQVRDQDGNPADGVSVSLQTAQFTLTTLTNSSGHYMFPGVPAGNYAGTARAGGCAADTEAVAVSGNTVVNFTLSETPDAFGYRCGVENAAFEEANATLHPITGTSGVGTINLPFPFTFYGQTYSQAYLCANGFLEFVGPGTTNCSSANGTIPGTGRPNGAIYPLWDDLNNDVLSSIRSEVKGTAPNRSFVIEFRNVYFATTTTQRVDFNVVLRENGEILTQYRNISNDGRERGEQATIGIEMETGTVALMYSLNTAVLRLEPAITTIRYRPPQLFTVSGNVQDDTGAPAAGVTVSLQASEFTLSTTTDTAGSYSFPGVPARTYTANARAGGCAGDTETVTVSSDTIVNFQLGDVPDAFGYRCRQENTAFEEAGTVRPITGTSGVGTVDLPFPFTFYGQTYSQAYVCANGFIEFVGPSTTTCGTNGSIPTTGRPNGAIYPFWDDLTVDASASIRTEVKGSEPNRMFVIEFRNVNIANNNALRLDFNTVLFENGEILTQYRNIGTDGRERGNSATIGIEIHSGTVALLYSQNTAVLPMAPAVTSIRYRPPQLFAVSGQVRDSAGNPAPNVSVTLERAPFTLASITDSSGMYAFAGVPEGAYAATAKAGGCSGHAQTVNISADTTVNFTLGDLGDAFGYRCRFETAAFEEGVTIVPIFGDDFDNVAGTIELGFPFTFYGESYTDAHVCINGFIEFAGPDTTNCQWVNSALPDSDRPNGAIYSFWDDLEVDNLAAILTDVKGTAPNRRFVIEFRNVHIINDLTRRLDFNIVLHEDGRIMTQYRNLANDARERGSSATIGIEDPTATIALQFSMNEAVLPPEPNVTSIVYRPPGMP